MKIGTWARLLLAGAPLLAGCANFWQTPSSTSTTTTPSILSSGVFYVLNQGTKQIAAYTIATGKLTQILPVTTLSAAPYSIAIAPSSGFLYVGTAQGIYLYTIGSGGALSLANNASAISSDVATTMQVDGTGSWLLEAGPNLAELMAIPINPSTGIPTSTIEQNTLLPSLTAQQLVISPDNTHVFVAMGSSGTEDVVFSAASSTPFGTAVNIGVKNTAGAAVSVAVDPANRLVYVGETAATSGSNTGGVRVFNYNTLTELSGSPYASGGLAPYSILPISSGDLVYVANRSVSGSSNGNVAGFSVTTTGTVYSLTALSTTISTGITPVGMALDSLSHYLLVVDSGGSPDLEAYTFDATTTSKLDSALTATTGTDPVGAVAIAALP